MGRRGVLGFFRRGRRPAAFAVVGGLFVVFCVVAVERERRTAEREGLVAARFVPATSADVRSDGANVFVPFDSPRALADADRAVAEFLRTTERRTDSPEASAFLRAQIFEARRLFATADAAKERRLRRVDDARTAARAVETLRGWTESLNDGGVDDIDDFDGVHSSSSGVFSFSRVEAENSNAVDSFNDFDGDLDSDLAAATAFLAELSEEPSSSSVEVAPLTALDDAGDFRDAVVFLNANALTPVPVALETVVADAAPRTLAVVGAFGTFFSLFGTFGARFFAVDWARFFSTWNRFSTKNGANAASSTRFLTPFERWSASQTLAELAVVRLLN